MVQGTSLLAMHCSTFTTVYVLKLLNKCSAQLVTYSCSDVPDFEREKCHLSARIFFILKFQTFLSQTVGSTVYEVRRYAHAHNIFMQACSQTDHARNLLTRQTIAEN